MHITASQLSDSSFLFEMIDLKLTLIISSSHPDLGDGYQSDDLPLAQAGAVADVHRAILSRIVTLHGVQYETRSPLLQPPPVAGDKFAA